jgi:hypothetical protein
MTLLPLHLLPPSSGTGKLVKNEAELSLDITGMEELDPSP